MIYHIGTGYFPLSLIGTHTKFKVQSSTVQQSQIPPSLRPLPQILHRTDPLDPDPDAPPGRNCVSVHFPISNMPSRKYHANIMWIMPRSPNIISSNIQTVFKEHRDLLRRLIVKFSYSGVTVPVTIGEWRPKLVASSQFGLEASTSLNERGLRFAAVCLSNTMMESKVDWVNRHSQSCVSRLLILVPSFKLRLHRLVIVFVFVCYAVIHRCFVFKVVVVFVLYFIIVIFYISLNAA